MKSLVKVSLKYGLVAGALGSLILAGLYYMDRHPLVIPVYLDFRIILFAVFIFFTLREIRDYHQAGVLYFWQGIFSSFLFTVFFSVVSSLFLVVFIRVVPAFLDSYIQLSMQQLESLPDAVVEKIGKEVYNRNVALLPGTKSADLAFLFFWQSFMISLFISIILSVILRRQPKI